MFRSIFALALLSSPAMADDLLFFHSPSGNIQCMIATGDWAAARCDMGNLSPTYTTPPADCDLDWGSSFEIGPNDRKGYLACVGDTVANPDGLVLDYGKSVSLDGFTCTSEESGMTCTNAGGHGFSIAKARQKLF